MSGRHSHWLEKLQVQLATVGCGLAAYFVIGPIVRPTDPAGPVVFLATGSAASIALLAVSLGVLAAACGLVTISARPQGAVLAMVLGSAGISLHSGRARALLWTREGDLPGLFWQMALEVVALAAVMAIAAMALVVMRSLAVRALPRWTWQDPLLDAAGKPSTDPAVSRGSPLARCFGLGAAPGTAGRGIGGKEELTRGVLCFLLTLAITVAVVLLLMRSVERGQILFALVAGCFLGALLAQVTVPTRSSLIAWTAPVVVAIGFYVLAATSMVRSGFGAWMDVPGYARALPIDWATAGVGGALLGHWVSLRMREAKLLEQEEQSEDEKGR